MSNRSEQQAGQHAGKKAAEFFTRPGLSRLAVKLYEKYIEVGQVGGQVILMDATLDERRDIASFLGKPLYADTRLKVRLKDVEKALEHSFRCTLPDMLRAHFPDKELVTRAQQRADHAIYQ
ncbi:MAG TPA: TIGR02679 domain-containing protein, partial [Ktedonobacteraceae bacterium]